MNHMSKNTEDAAGLVKWVILLGIAVAIALAAVRIITVQMQ